MGDSHRHVARLETVVVEKSCFMHVSARTGIEEKDDEIKPLACHILVLGFTDMATGTLPCVFH